LRSQGQVNDPQEVGPLGQLALGVNLRPAKKLTIRCGGFPPLHRETALWITLWEKTGLAEHNALKYKENSREDSQDSAL
jgi:hypothetical protein